MPSRPVFTFTLDVGRKCGTLISRMILSFHDKRTRDFAEGKRVREFEAFRQQAEKRLDILEAATSLDDLRALPSNRLEALKGDRRGQYSIRINMQWRICFIWPSGQSGPSDVEIVDYH
jgi:toxin HigB-1